MKKATSYTEGDVAKVWKEKDLVLFSPLIPALMCRLCLSGDTYRNVGTISSLSAGISGTELRRRHCLQTDQCSELN